MINVVSGVKQGISPMLFGGLEQEKTLSITLKVKYLRSKISVCLSAKQSFSLSVYSNVEISSVLSTYCLFRERVIWPCVLGRT